MYKLLAIFVGWSLTKNSLLLVLFSWVVVYEAHVLLILGNCSSGRIGNGWLCFFCLKQEWEQNKHKLKQENISGKSHKKTFIGTKYYKQRNTISRWTFDKNTQFRKIRGLIKVFTSIWGMEIGSLYLIKDSAQGASYRNNKWFD